MVTFVLNCLCAYDMCVCADMCICECVCVCVCPYTHMKARRRPQVLALACDLVWDRVFLLLWLTTTVYTGLAGPWVSRDSPISLPHLILGLRRLPHSTVCGFWGLELRSSNFSSRHLIHSWTVKLSLAILTWKLLQVESLLFVSTMPQCDGAGQRPQ